MNISVMYWAMRERKRSILWTSASIFFITAGIMAIYPSIAGVPEVQAYVEALPEEMTAFIGIRDLDMNTLAGFLEMELFSFMMPAIFIIFGIGFASGLTAGDEEQGRLEMLLAGPVSRGQVWVQRVATFWVGMTVAAVALGASMFGVARVMRLDIDSTNIVAASVNMWSLGAVVGGLVLAVSGWTGKKGRCIQVAIAVTIASYLLNSMGLLVDALEPFRPFTFFYYITEPQVIVRGIDPLYTFIVVIGAILLSGLGWIGFHRRDLNRG